MPVSKKIDASAPRRATITARIRNSPVGLAASAPRSSESDLYMKLYPHSALSAFIENKGEQSQESWNILSFRLHLALTLLQAHAPHEKAAKTLQRGIQHLITAQAVHAATNNWKLTRPAQKCIGDGLHIADDLQSVTTRAQERAAGIALVKACKDDLKRLGMTPALAKRVLAA